MRHPTMLSLIGAAVCAAVLTGCTTTSEGQPLPQLTGTSETTTMETPQTSAPHPTSPANGELPSDGAPKVRNPLNTNRFQQKPCEMLTPAQLQELNLPAQGELGRGPLGLACGWLNRETGGGVHVQWGDKNPRGLSGMYAARKEGKWAYFVEYADVEGFPAVAASLSDERDTGNCTMFVGVTDQLSFLVGVQLSLRNIGQKDPCEATVQVAGMMLKTMKAGG